MKSINYMSLAAILAGISGTPSPGAPVKKLLLEEFTAAWCGWCPDVGEPLKKLRKQSDRAIVVSYHSENDNMSNPLSEEFEMAYGKYVEGYPTLFVDRGLYDGQMDVDIRDMDTEAVPFKTKYENLLAQPAQAAIAFQDMKWNAATRTISGTLSATLAADQSGDLRIGLIVTEDSVTGGTGGATMVGGVVKKDPDPGNTAYDQNAGSDIAEMYPDLKYSGGHIVGYPHDYVARAAVFGAFGKEGIIPAQAKAATPYTLPFTYQVPERYDPTAKGLPVNLRKIALVAYVAKYASNVTGRNVLNAEEVSLAPYLSSTAVRSPGRKAEAGLVQAPGASYVMVHADARGPHAVSLFDIRGTLLATLHPDLSQGMNRIEVPAEIVRRNPGILITRITRTTGD